MTIHATMNPVGSTNPKDLIDNAQNLDWLILGPLLSYPDRRGVNRLSWAGIEASFAAAQAQRTIEFVAAQGDRTIQFNAFMDASGYEPPIAYAEGILLDRTTKSVTYLGNEYRAKSAFIPFTTTNWAADEAKLKLIGDDSLRQGLGSNGGDKGASLVYGAARVVDTVASMKALTDIPIGSRVMTLGYFSRGDCGANVYTVISSAGVTGDLGTNIVVGPVAFRGEFPFNFVHIKQFGAKSDGIILDHASFLEGRAKARSLGVFLDFGIGTTLLSSFTPSDKDKMRGLGSTLTFLAFTAGDTGVHMSNKPYGVRHDNPPAYIKDTQFTGFTVMGTNVKIGIYAAANLFSYWDDVRSRNSQICNWFNAYIFGGKWMHCRADYGVGSGWEFGYNRFGWTPSVPGELPALCHGATIMRVDAYGNGTGLLERPPLGSVMGAGLVFADGLSNSVLLVYGEQNFGHGLVTVGSVSYAIETVYLEMNDKFKPEGADRYDYYNAAAEMSIGNLGPIFTTQSTVWNAGRLGCTNFRGTKIDGPGPAKVTENYRNATISNPSVLSIPLLSRFGTVAQLQRGYTLPKSMPSDGTSQFFRGGVYRCYPEIVLEGSAVNIAGARVIITKTDGTEMYNKKVFSPGNPVAGMRMTFPLTDFLWDNTQNYRLTLSEVAPYTGDMVLNFIADIMA